MAMLLVFSCVWVCAQGLPFIGMGAAGVFVPILPACITIGGHIAAKAGASDEGEIDGCHGARQPLLLSGLRSSACLSDPLHGTQLCMPCRNQAPASATPKAKETRYAFVRQKRGRSRPKHTCCWH